MESTLGEGSTSSPNSTSTTTARPTSTPQPNSLPSSQPNSNSNSTRSHNPTLALAKPKPSKPLPPLPKSTYTTLTVEATKHRGRLVRWFLEDELAKRTHALDDEHEERNEPRERKGGGRVEGRDGGKEGKGVDGERERERERKELEEISKRKEGWACAVEEGLDELGRCFASASGSGSISEGGGEREREWLRELRRVRRMEARVTAVERQEEEEMKEVKEEKDGEKEEIEQKRSLAKSNSKSQKKKKRKSLLLLVSFAEPTTSHNHDHVSSPRLYGGGKEPKEPKVAIGIRFRENVWDRGEVLFGRREEDTSSSSHIGGTFYITGLPSSPSSPSSSPFSSSSPSSSHSGAHALLIQILKLSTYTQLSLILEHHLLSDSSVPLTYPRPKLPGRGVGGGSVPSPVRGMLGEAGAGGGGKKDGKRKEGGGGFFGGALMNFFSRNSMGMGMGRSKTISTSPFSFSSSPSPTSSTTPSPSSPSSPTASSTSTPSSPFNFSRPKPQIQTPLGLPTLDIGTSGFRRFSIVGESGSSTSSSSSSSGSSPVSGSLSTPGAGAGSSAVDHLRNQVTKGGGDGGGRKAMDTPYLKTFIQLQKSRFLLSTSPGVDIPPPTLITQLAQIEASHTHPSSPPTTSPGNPSGGRHNYHPVIRLKGDQKTALSSMLGWEWSGVGAKDGTRGGREGGVGGRGGGMGGVEGFVRQQGLEGVVSWGVCASGSTTTGSTSRTGAKSAAKSTATTGEDGSKMTSTTTRTTRTGGSGEGSTLTAGGQGVERSATESTTTTATTTTESTTTSTSTTSSTSPAPIPPLAPTISAVSSTPTSSGEREKESFVACGQPRWRSWRYFSYTSSGSPSTSPSAPSSSSSAPSSASPSPLDETLEDTLRNLAEGADEPCQGKGKKGEVCGRKKGEHEMRVGHGRVCVVVRVREGSTSDVDDENEAEVVEKHHQQSSEVSQGASEKASGEAGDVKEAKGGKEVKEPKKRDDEKAGEAKKDETDKDGKQDEKEEEKEEDPEEEEEEIETYTSCSICGAKTQRRRVSDGTLLYSTGKFIELLIYSPSLCLLKPTLCEHTKPPPLPWPVLPGERFNLVRHFVVRSSAFVSLSGDEKEKDGGREGKDGKDGKDNKEGKEAKDGKEKPEKDGRKEEKKPKDADKKERKKKTYTISFSTMPIDDLHDLKVPRLQIIRGHHHAVPPDSGPGLAQSSTASAGKEEAKGLGGAKESKGEMKGDGKGEGKAEEDEKRKLRREMRTWWEGVYGHIDELETILADTGEAMERAKAREASTSTSATEESRLAEDVQGEDLGGIDRATTPTPGPSSPSTPPTPTPNYVPRKLKALPRLPSEDADFHEAATPVATQRFRFPGKETYPGLGGLEEWLGSVAVPPSTPVTARNTVVQGDGEGAERGREFPGDPVTPRKVSGGATGGGKGKEGDYFGPGNEDTPTVLPFPPPPTPQSSERSKASASGTVASEKGTTTTTPTRSNSVKTSVLSTSSGRTNGTATTKASNTNTTTTTNSSTTTSPITQETITALETKLSNLRFTFQRMEQSLYAQLGRTADGNLNDVRRNFEAAARGVEKRLRAWQRKNFGGVEATRMGLGLGVDSGSHVGASAEPTAAVAPAPAPKGEETVGATGAPEGSMIGTAVSAGVAAAAGSVAGGGVGAAGGTLVDATKGVGRGKVPEYTPKADPGWWGETCHAAPGSSIIVREDDWSSLIAYTLSTSDYLIELANMSFARFGSTSNSVTTPELPTDSSVSTKESSLFSAALGYKLFTVAVNQNSSTANAQAQGDPDAEGVIWNEPEMFNATITRVSHPRDTSGGAGMSIFKDVMRQKSVDVSSLASRNAAAGGGGGSGSGHTGERAVGGGGGVPGVAGSRTSTTAQPPPMAYAKPDVGITKGEVDGELTVKQRGSKGDAGKETVDRLLLDLEQFSGEKGQKTAGLYNSPSGSTLSTVSKKSKPPSIVSVMSTDTQSTVGKSEETNRTSPDTQPVPPPVPPKDQQKAEKQGSGTRSPPSTTTSTIANTLSSGISNAMRFVRRDHTTSRPMSPISKGHHGLLLAEPATGVEDRPHIKYEWTIGKRLKFTCTVYYAKQFDSLRKRCGIDDSFVQSLARSSHWLAEGGKSKSRFRKTEDGKFIIKTLLDTWNVADLQVLLELAPSYFQYMDSTASKATSLAKMMGFYSVEIKNVETGVVQSQADLLVMENLFYGYKITKVFDLKGISGRKVKPKNRDIPGNAAPRTLFDGEWIEGQQKALVLVKPHSRQVLRCALRNDAEFLARSNIMDYSLLVGVEESTKEIICGIVDTIGSYTIAKTLEYKAKQNLQSGKETTVMPPAEYQERFINALEGYFVACPDKWSKPEDSSKLIQNINELPSVL